MTFGVTSLYSKEKAMKSNAASVLIFEVYGYKNLSYEFNRAG